MSVRTSGWLAALTTAAVIAGGCGAGGQQSNTARTPSQQSNTARTPSKPKSGGQITESAGAAHARPTVGQDLRRGSRSRSNAEALATASKGIGSRHRAAGGPAKVNDPKPPLIQAGPLVGGFSGTGSKAIGALSEKTSVVLEWRTATPPMQIFNSRGFLLVNSNLPSGRVRLASGEYRNLHVGAKGPWTIKIHASA